ncbi:MAG: hypothetical protein ABMA14_00080 [Hyphomonadaceae bacterium]
MFDRKGPAANPVNYNEWAQTLAASGAFVEVDATKILLPDALSIVKSVPSSATGMRVLFFNCGNIPWDLRLVATQGGARVGFRL